MNNNDKATSFLCSWPAIVIAFCFCWPIGLVLLIKRFSMDKTAVMHSGAVVSRVIGIIMICIGALGCIGVVDNFNVAALVVLLFFVIGGIVLLRKSAKLKAEGQTIRKYISIIVNHNVRDIDSISKAMGRTYEKARADVQELIDKGYLKNAYIDMQIGQVVLASDHINNSAVSQAQEQARADLRPRVVTCKCCGANNTVVGPVGKCEYCDSPIQ